MSNARTKEAPAIEEPSAQQHRGEPQVRQCLRCRADFHSEWSGERICARCKGTSAWRSGLPVRSASSGNSRG
jgi:hypothetical protein